MRQLKISKGDKNITKREEESLDKYLRDIGKEELITPEEEVELTQRIKAGDQIALEKLCKANLRFVVSVAKQYQNQGLSLPDLINEGNLGLIKAARRFDETRGFKFISYAVWWIRQGILQALAEVGRPIRLPLNKVGSVTKINRIIEKHEQVHGYQLTTDAEILLILDEIEDFKMKKKERIESIRARKIKMFPIEAPLVQDQNITLLDVFVSIDNSMEADYFVLKKSFNFQIERILSFLTPEEKDIIFMAFGINYPFPYTLEEIGEKYGFSRGWANARKIKILRKLKRLIKLRGIVYEK